MIDNTYIRRKTSDKQAVRVSLSDEECCAIVGCSLEIKYKERANQQNRNKVGLDNHEEARSHPTANRVYKYFLSSFDK